MHHILYITRCVNDATRGHFRLKLVHRDGVLPASTAAESAGIIISVLCADTNITLSDDTWHCCVLLIMKLDPPLINQPWGRLSNMISIHSLTCGTYTMTIITRNLQLELIEPNQLQ